ncbi:MAG: hypothetical protein Kow00121_35630 [Elainellaceae cyanobacterium]
MRIAIIGAGVSGSIIATGLAKLPGVAVSVFERVGPEDHDLAGNGLNVGPNAIKSLRASIPELAAQLEATSLPWTAWTTWTMEGDLLYCIPLQEVAENNGIRIRWAELYRICRQGARDIIQFYTECTSVKKQLSSSGVQINLELLDSRMGSRSTMSNVDLLIVADGRFSSIRAQLYGRSPVTYLGVANFRVLLNDQGRMPLDDLEQWYNGPHRLLAFRLVDGLIYLSGNFPIEPNAETTAEQKRADFLRKVYTPASGRMASTPQWLLDSACEAEQELHWSRAQESTGLWHDETGHILFPGDSGHPMVPTLGQGATLAIEDACIFVNLFQHYWGKALSGSIDIPALTREFAVLRDERTEFIKRFSWDASDTLRPGSDAIADNRKKNGPDYRAKLRRMYVDIPSMPASQPGPPMVRV